MTTKPWNSKSECPSRSSADDLTCSRDVFSAGASLYGVADCELLAQETHKFESRYLDGLIGALPEHRDIYKARSPIHSVDKIRAPIIFFQASKDSCTISSKFIKYSFQTKAE